MIKKIEEPEYKALFKKHIRRDFAFNERRPLSLIRRLHRRGLYDFMGLYDDATGGLMAYAGLLRVPGVNTMLLDYLAVEPEQRGGGTGSRFLGELAAHCDADGILIECEAPEAAGNAEEQKTRQRRIGFYLRNGAEMTGTGWRFFGVDYGLLWLPIHKAAEEVDIAGDIVTLYGTGTSWLLRQLTGKVLAKDASVQ